MSHLPVVSFSTYSKQSSASAPTPPSLPPLLLLPFSSSPSPRNKDSPNYHKQLMLKSLLLRCFCFNSKFLGKEPFKQSKYYIPKEPVENFLNKMNINFRTSPNGLKIKQCLFCSKPHNNDPTNLFTLNVHRESGGFHCFRCSSSGSYLDLKGRVLGIDGNAHRYSPPQTNSQEQPQGYQGKKEWNNSATPTRASQTISESEYMAHFLRMNSKSYADIKAYLTEERGITQETLNAYRVGAGEELFYSEEGGKNLVKVIYFPMFGGTSDKEKELFKKEIADYVESHKGDESSIRLSEGKINTELAKIVKYKIRGASKDTKQYTRQFPVTQLSGFFGYNLVTADTKEVVITEGEMDAMSVYQKTGKIALSLPQGASHLPDQLVPLLDQFQKVILWMDNDKAGELNTPKIAHKTGIKRTFVVQNEDRTVKDANDVLRRKPQLFHKLISEAQTIPGKNILNFTDLKSKLKFNIYNAEKLAGIPSTSFEFFNKRVKGLRKGELSILSGGTGSGKTTLLSQLSLDFCQQEVGTLWGSFEIKNDVLAFTMLSQHSQINLKKHKEKFDYYADKFSNLPLHWLSFYGSTDLEKVFGTIEYAIEKYDVSHVVIDTLQFLLSDQAEGYRKFDLQDATMGRLRRLATDFDVHVTVVIHPKKTEEGLDLGLNTIFGSAKSVQEADNVWMIQLRDGYKIFEVKKNRFDGELGKVAIGFNKNSRSFFELKKDELERIHKRDASVDEIVQQRESNKGYNEAQRDKQELMMALNPNGDNGADLKPPNSFKNWSNWNNNNRRN